MITGLSFSKYAVHHNAQLKLYPDGSAVLQCFDRALIREHGFEERGKHRFVDLGEDGEEDGADHGGRSADNLARSKRRARASVYDIAMSSDFEWFVTLTLDAAKVDRYDASEVFRHLRYWLDNHVRRDGLSYLLVPEHHKDGALHFHALFNDALPVVDSGTVSLPGCKAPKRPRSKAQRQAWLDAGGQAVYNLPSWPYGYTTAIRLYGDRDAAVGYVTKYISKSDCKIGGRWYYSGGDLRRPDVVACDVDYERAAALKGASCFNLDEIGARGCKLKFRPEDDLFDTLQGIR